MHRLRDIIILAICGVISGADGWVEIEEFGKAKQAWFTELLHLPNVKFPHFCGNVLDQDFTASRPYEKWTGDITAIWTYEGWLYLAVGLNLFSRRVIGWAMAATQDETLIETALRMALGGGVQRLKCYFIPIVGRSIPVMPIEPCLRKHT